MNSASGSPPKLRAPERDAILQALRAGVVPRVGLQHIQVGREREVQQIVVDAERMIAGGSALRFVIGDYGSGKTFFLNLARAIALRKKLVVVHADLSPDRRLYAANGKARALYAEAMRNLATLSKPEGGAMGNVVERFIAEAKSAAVNAGTSVDVEIGKRLQSISDWVGGHDLAVLIERYHAASVAGDEATMNAALRWLRGEYSLKTEARSALGVRSIIDDADIYDSLKLIGRLCVLAGYSGLFVVFDELVNVFKIVEARSRDANYEQLLRIVNDVLQGSAEHLGFYFGGTPETLMDGRRGIYSYEALRSRLAENAFAHSGLVDVSGPVLRLQSLTQEELYVLLGNLRRVHGVAPISAEPLPDEALVAFMQYCHAKIGDSYFRTPRNTIRSFLDLLAILDQNPGTSWQGIIKTIDVKADLAATSSVIDDAAPTTDGSRPPHIAPRDGDLSKFRL